jgi:uncharacterized repeat protein (TIGR03803 family)
MPSVGSAMSALASFSNQAGQVFYEAISTTVNTAQKTAMAAWDAACTEVVANMLNAPAGLTIGAYFVEIASRPQDSPTQGLMIWNQTTGVFAPFQQCSPSMSSKRVLVVVHGMLSSVEASYSSMLKSTSLISSVPYGAVYGIDYDWWDGLQSNGKTVSGLLDTVSTCEKGNPIDVLAHSEGVPVTFSALAQDTTAKPSIRNLIEVAGPILGTPMANTFRESLGTARYGLLTVIANWPNLDMVFPPPTPGGILDLLQAQFATDLATDSSGSSELANIRGLWEDDSFLSRLPVIMSGGTSPKFPELQFLCTGCLGIFESTPFDGVVGLDSAFGEGLDLLLFRIPALPDFHTDLVTDPRLTGNQTAFGSLSLQLTTPEIPKLIITSSSNSASCHDSHWCSGLPGSVFTFTATNITKGTSKLQIYVQDPTGTQDPVTTVAALPDGTFTWSDPTSPSKAAGIYGYWIVDPTNGVSNSVIETICSATCPSIIPTIAIEIAPNEAQVPAGGSQQFRATATNSTDIAVNWSVNGVGGGDSTVGTISDAGTYTAPAQIPGRGVVTVTATSMVDASISGYAVLTIGPYKTQNLYSFSSLTDGAAPSAPLIQAKDGFYYGTTQLGGSYGDGTIFKVDASGNIASVYEFSGTDGANPIAPLIQATDGSLYGTTDWGGAFGEGTLFKVDTDGSLQILHSFTGGNDGGDVSGKLTLATDGFLYGTTFHGGTYNSGTVFRMDLQGNLTTLYSFTGGADGYGPEALIQGSDGFFYGVAQNGGNASCQAFGGTGCGTIFVIDSQGSFKVLYSFNGIPDGAQPEEALLEGTDGALYGTTLFGGNAACSVSSYPGCGTIFKIDTKGNYTLLYGFTGGAEGGVPFSSLIQASDGDFYGTNTAGGDVSCSVIASGENYSTYTGCGTVFKMDSAGHVTALNSFKGSPADGSNPFATLLQGSDGYFYGTTRWGGTAISCPYTDNGGCGTFFRVSGPAGPLAQDRLSETRKVKANQRSSIHPLPKLSNPEHYTPPSHPQNLGVVSLKGLRTPSK